jgi:hypothetical protein
MSVARSGAGRSMQGIPGPRRQGAQPSQSHYEGWPNVFIMRRPYRRRNNPRPPVAARAGVRDNEAVDSRPRAWPRALNGWAAPKGVRIDPRSASRCRGFVRPDPPRGLPRIGTDLRRPSGEGEATLPSRSPPSPHFTQSESPARPAVVLFRKTSEIFKSKAGRQIGRKEGLGRQDPVQGIAKLDHPVSRESAGKNSGDRGPYKL